MILRKAHAEAELTEEADHIDLEWDEPEREQGLKTARVMRGARGEGAAASRSLRGLPHGP